MRHVTDIPCNPFGARNAGVQPGGGDHTQERVEAVDVDAVTSSITATARSPPPATTRPALYTEPPSRRWATNTPSPRSPRKPKRTAPGHLAEGSAATWMLPEPMLSATVPELDPRPGWTAEHRWVGFRMLSSIAQGDRTGRTPPAALDDVPATGQQHGLPAGRLVTELRAHLGQPPRQHGVHHRRRPAPGRRCTPGRGRRRRGPGGSRPPMPGVRLFSAIPL